MSDKFKEKDMEQLGILAQLEIQTESQNEIKKDLEEMLSYIEKLNELDTNHVDPMSHIFPVYNVFREDEITNDDFSLEVLKNAPEVKEHMILVPCTVE